MRIKQNVEIAALRKVYNWLDQDPANRLPKLGEYIDSYIPAGSTIGGQLEAIKSVLRDSENNWFQLIFSIFTEIDSDVRRTIFENFVINATVRAGEIHDKLTLQYNCNIPWAILMDPTSACNLHCVGCWAAEYGNRLNLSYEELDSIIHQANELGCYFFLYTGGEPLVRKADLIRLCEAHPDSMFSAFTNATLIDEAFANEMLRVKNFIPAISVEGFEKSTDSRRGQGTYQKIMSAMQILKEKKLPFGISACYTSANVQDAVPKLMVSAEQRRFMYEQVRAFRKTKPLLLIAN